MGMKDALAIKWLLTEEAKSSWLSILANPDPANCHTMVNY